MKTLLKVFFKTALIFFVLNFTTFSSFMQKDDITINTRLGKVKGSLMKTRQGENIFAFRGLNYAEPPIGELRFKDPVPVKPWTGIRDASKEGPACIQPTGINLSEDCLTLNIYTKALQNSWSNVKKIPVIVYLHSGGYYAGSSQSFLYGPRYLLDQNIVLVTVNYRLSFLGFINTGDEYSTGNYAFKDQVLALRFVKDNIEAFGGDPNLVTLTGQSSGSRSIILHMVSPMSKGLFHRAIAMSGSPILPIPPQKEQFDLVLKKASLLNCTLEPRKKLFECLRKTPAEAFKNSLKGWYTSPHLIWHPAIEPEISGNQRFLVENPEKLLKKGKTNSVPLIIGLTKDEFYYKVSYGIKESLRSQEKFFEELNDRWYDLAPINFGYERGTESSKFISREVYRYYFGNKTISLHNSKMLGKLYADSLANYPIYKAANLIADYSSSPVYFYNFTYQGRYSRRFWSDTKQPSAGVAHGDDLQYIFNIDNDIYTHGEFPFFIESDQEILMVKRLTTMWAHFAKTGEPLPKFNELFDNVSWIKYDSESKNVLNIGKVMKMENNVFDDTMRFWNSLFPS